MKTTLQHTTHITRTRQERATLIERICELLNWSHDQYCWHQYEQYELFLSQICAGYPVIYYQLRYSSVFRGFFNITWDVRTKQEFLPFAKDFEPGDAYLVDEYLLIHNYRRLLNDDEFMMEYNHILRLI